MITDDNISKIFRRFTELEAGRIQHEYVWDDIAFYSCPDKGYVQFKDTKGSIRTEQIFDNSAGIALRNLTATLNSMLTSQFSTWFDLTTNKEDFNDDPAGKEWLEYTTETLTKIFTNSNFYVEVFKFYFDLCSMGTAVLYVEEDDRLDKEVRFSTRHIREIFFSENKYGEIDTVFRKVPMTARQIVQRWGIDVVSKNVKDLYKDKPDTEVEILHCVYPREDAEYESQKNTDLPFASYWIEYKERNILDESGYEELPYIIARWFVNSCEVYGRSPMYVALPDVITLNRMMELTLLTTELAIKPALVATPDLLEHQEVIRIEPGSVTVSDENGSIKPIWDASRGIPITIELIQIFKDQVANTLLSNQLQLVDQSQMTAEEVRARMAENSKAIGPTFGRLQSEFLENLINRVYALTLRQVDATGKPKIQPAPVDTDAEMEVKFVSPLAKQQRSAEINGIYSTIQWAMEAAQVAPQMLDNINFDQVLRILADANDAPLEMIRDEREVTQIRQMRAQQQQQAQQMQIQMAQQKENSENNRNNAQANKQNTEAENMGE